LTEKFVQEARSAQLLKTFYVYFYNLLLAIEPNRLHFHFENRFHRFQPFFTANQDRGKFTADA